MMTESVVLNDAPPARAKTARFQDPTPSAPSTRIRSHSHRQQTHPPLPLPAAAAGGGGGGSPGSRHSEYPWPQQAVAYPTARDAGPPPAAPPPSSANRTSKYGGLSRLPFVPAALRDVFSAASAEFHLPPAHAPTLYLASLPPPGGGAGIPGDAAAAPPPSSTSSAAASSSVRRVHSGSALAMPSAPQGSALPRAPRPRETLATGAPPRGLVAWCVAPSAPGPAGGEAVARAPSPVAAAAAAQEEVCVVSVGLGGSGRFERFRVEPDGAGRVKLVFVGWKPFAEDEAA
jgi:hypothetical protein